MPLQQHTPPDRVKNTGSEPLAVATTTTQCAGALPHPPLDSTTLSSPRGKHCRRRPCHTRHSTPHSTSVSEVAVEMESKDASLPKISSNNQANAAGRLHLVDSPSHLATTARVASQRSRLCHLLTLYRTKWPSQAEQPAAVRCKPSRPTMPVPLVPSSDAVPHRTDSHQAMSAAVVRCTQPTNNHVPTPGRHQDHDCRCVGSATPFELFSHGGNIDPGSSPHGQWAGNATNRAGSLETTPPRRARRRKRCRRSSRKWTGFSPREPHAAELELQNDAPNRENDIQGRRRHPTGKNAGKGFRPKHPNPMLHVHGATFGHHIHRSPSGVTPLPFLHAPCRRSSTFASSAPDDFGRRTSSTPLLPRRVTTGRHHAHASTSIAPPAGNTTLSPHRPRPRRSSPLAARGRPSPPRDPKRPPPPLLSRRPRLQSQRPPPPCRSSRRPWPRSSSPPCAPSPRSIPRSPPRSAAARQPMATTRAQPRRYRHRRAAETTHEVEGAREAAGT